MAESLLQMGAVGRPHGIKGEIGVNWQASTPPRSGDQLLFQAGDAHPAPRRVVSSRMHNGRLLLTLEGIDDRTEADALKGQKILMPREQLPPLAEDEAYVEDLSGSSVFLADGSLLGRLDHVEFPAGQMIWSILTPAGREILFPAEPCFIKALDMEKHEAVIDPPPGLLEVYGA